MMNVNWQEMLQQLQRGRAAPGGSFGFREQGRAIPQDPMQAQQSQLGSAFGTFGRQMPPQNVRPMPLPQPMDGLGTGAGWGNQIDRIGSSGSINNMPTQIPRLYSPGTAPMTSMPSMPGMGGGMMPPQDPNQFLPRMGADPRMMLPRTGPMPQQQGGMGNTLAQIMGSVQGQQQQPVSPWGSGGPMRARGGSTY